jgi:hypothetical protein
MALGTAIIAAAVALLLIARRASTAENKGWKRGSTRNI